MSEKWISYFRTTILLLALIGISSLFRNLVTPDPPRPIPPSPSPTFDKTTEKVRLLVRSQEEKKPIQDVSVEFAVSNGPSVTEPTDSSGFADIEIPQGVNVVIHLNHKDYVRATYTLNPSVEPGKTKEFFLKLKAKASVPSISTPPISEFREHLPIENPASTVNEPDLQRVQPLPKKPIERPNQANQSSPPPSANQKMGDGNIGTTQINGNSNQVQNDVNIGK